MGGCATGREPPASSINRFRICHASKDASRRAMQGNYRGFKRKGGVKKAIILLMWLAHIKVLKDALAS